MSIDQPEWGVSGRAEGQRSLLQNEPAPADGRRRRSLKSRRRIVDAMIALVRAGNLSPSAEAVSREANVSLRTVFRHFEDMDSLYREMALSVEADVMPIVLAPLPRGAWIEILRELIERRSRVFEHILPFRRAANLRRHQSEMLTELNQSLARVERQILCAVAPPELVNNNPCLEALDLLLSFDAWLRLRLEQKLEVANARETLHVAASAVSAAASAQAT